MSAPTLHNIAHVRDCAACGIGHEDHAAFGRACGVTAMQELDCGVLLFDIRGIGARYALAVALRR